MAAGPRIVLLGREEVPPQLADLYDALLQTRGVVPNMFKTLAHTPALAMGVAGLLKPLMGDGALKGWYKELVACRIATLHHSAYAIAAHSLSARQKGATAEQVEGVKDFERGPFSEKEQLGFRCTDLLHVSGQALDDEAFALLKKSYTEAEIVELTVTAAAFEFFCRLVDGLRIPRTSAPQTAAAQAG